MAKNHSIPRKKSAPDGFSYVGLRRQGVAAAQQISGEQWSDYNLHDPGVTILEQLCYGLTDLINRAEFDVEDLLSDKHGKIDYAGLALHAPEEILSCRPTTPADYRRAILDRFPEIADVWLRLVEEGMCGYRIEVKRSHLLTSEQQACDLTGQVAQFYSSQRNLGEDIAEIVLIRDVGCELHGTIEVERGRNPANILADIYFACAQHISGTPRSDSYQQRYQAGQPLESLFQGPLTPHGYISDEALSECRDSLDMADFYDLINNVRGVEQIKQLSFCVDESAHNADQHASDCEVYDEMLCRVDDAALYLRVPDDLSAVRVSLISNGRPIDVSMADMWTRYNELVLQYHSFRKTVQSLSDIAPLPTGEYRAPHDYFSIQHQFPDLYGINQFGVPKSATDKEKGAAKQLKAYLLLFEQLMANYCANVEHLPTFFSLKDSAEHSYGYQVLNGDIVPNIDGLYPQNPDDLLSTLLSKYDNPLERKSRLLDYLLALYGESFSQNSLKSFCYYFSPDEAAKVVLKNKQRLLESVVESGRDRAAGCDYARPFWYCDNISGLQRRVSLLLGFHSLQVVSLTMPVLARGLRLVEKQASGEHEHSTMHQQVMDCFSPLLSSGEVDGQYHIDWGVAGFEGMFANGVLLGSDLREGVKTPNNLADEIQKNEGAAESSDSTSCDAKHMLQPELRRQLIALNQECEGMHVVEHLLLQSQDDDPFFHCQVSALFPAWTARCNDLQFRHLAEETVRLNTPAHLYCHSVWLGFDEMCEFEWLFFKWGEAKQRANEKPVELAAAAQALVVFLKARVG